MRIFDMHDRFPAIPALFAVGTSAVPALLEKLKTGKASQMATSNGIRAMVLINRDSPQEAVKVLKRAASNTKNSAEAEQLESCARDAVAFCAEKWRAQCENEAK